MEARSQPQPGLRRLRRGGGDPYTGPVATGPPVSTYAPYTSQLVMPYGDIKSHIS